MIHMATKGKKQRAMTTSINSDTNYNLKKTKNKVVAILISIPSLFYIKEEFHINLYFYIKMIKSTHPYFE